MTREDRVVFALRQAGLVVAVLCILWLMIVFVRPDLDSSGVGARGLFNVPMLLTVLVWPALLLFHAMAFERPRLSVVERVPLMAAIGITGILFILGALFSTASQSLRGLMWILLNSVAGGMFWWAVLGLAALVLERMRSTNGSRQADLTVP